MGDVRRQLIERWLKRINRFPLSLTEFFARHQVPFRRSQYFVYRRRYKDCGREGLVDRRTRGGNRKLPVEAEEFLRGCLRTGPGLSLEWLCEAVAKEYGCDLTLSGLSRALRRICPERSERGPGRPRHSAGISEEVNPLGGFELIVAVAHCLGWPERAAKLIGEAVASMKRERDAETGVAEVADTPGRNRRGHFTTRYNRRRDVRAARFASVSEKRATKKIESMHIVRDRAETIVRMCLAVLSLPLVTANGNVRTVNVAMGQYLKHLCGYNYRQSTVTRYLSELKYLGASRVLLDDLPVFWHRCWASELGAAEGPLLCYYIDGNTKALWSSQRVKQNKVTMLGRVMGCLEQVFIHDGFGHPIYFETYSGHAPLGEHVLGLFERIEAAISDVPRSSARVYRAIVMDAASNSVKTLRAFAAQDKYHYITPLDDNQLNEQRVLSTGRASRYRYGEATLRNLTLELEDSNEKGYWIRSRAVQIDWDRGTRTVLLSSLPAEVIDPSEVVYAYFRRWPSQELPFRHAKAVVSLGRVMGYGRKETENPRVLTAQQEAAEKVSELSTKLREPLCEIGTHDEGIARLIPKLQAIRRKCSVREGRRLVPPKLKDKHEAYEREICAHKRAIKRIEKQHAADFKSLRRHQKEWLRLQGKERVYEADVELDQIVTYFRITLANLYAYFLRHFLGESHISMLMLVHRIIQLPATIVESSNERRIKLWYNEQDEPMMRKLDRAIAKINALDIRGPRAKIMRFELAKPSPQ